MLLALIVVAMISLGQNREGKVVTGATTLKYPINFTAADTIDASETYWVLVDCKQSYAHTQTIAITIDSISGAPSLSISLEGKVNAIDEYAELVAAATWNEEADNTFTITVSSANKCRYFKIKAVASGATQKSRFTALAFTDTYQNLTTILATTAAFSGDVLIGQTTANETTPSLTIKGDADSDAGGDTNESMIIDLTPNATPTSAVWDVASTQSAGYRFDKSLAVGLATPNETLPTLSIRGDADSDAADVTDVLSVVLTPNATPTSSTWGFTSTQSAGYTFDKNVALNGGVTIPTQPTSYWAASGAIYLAAGGTDVACTNGGRFWVSLNIPYNSTITGLAYLVGSVGGTDSVVVQLLNSAGVQVATSRAVGGAAVIVGTAAEFQSVPFTAPYVAVAGRYFACLQFNGTTAKFRAYPIPGARFIANTTTGTWGTAANPTVGTTYVAGKAPFVMTY